MIIENGELFKIDLTAKTNKGKTGFQPAVMTGRHNVINLIARKILSITAFYSHDSK